ncbi:hypothetical protein E2C01_095047 [Portunus trituberculatus]|uniref:Uncharacterized protein n=1 Tax=Portunus trituberculatus TaxID=210409 RepID=A0A5B7JS48_PORTR|nr:hypothetical protein [Portunus trituberculatus]
MYTQFDSCFNSAMIGIHLVYGVFRGVLAKHTNDTATAFPPLNLASQCCIMPKHRYVSRRLKRLPRPCNPP